MDTQLRKIFFIPHEVHLHIASWVEDVDTAKNYAEALSDPRQHPPYYGADIFEKMAHGSLRRFALKIATLAELERKVLRASPPTKSQTIKEIVLGHFSLNVTRLEEFKAESATNKRAGFLPSFGDWHLFAAPSQLKDEFEQAVARHTVFPSKFPQGDAYYLWVSQLSLHRSRFFVMDWLRVLKSHIPNHPFFTLNPFAWHDVVTFNNALFPRLLNPLKLAETCDALRLCSVFGSREPQRLLVAHQIHDCLFGTPQKPALELTPSWRAICTQSFPGRLILLSKQDLLDALTGDDEFRLVWRKLSSRGL